MDLIDVLIGQGILMGAFVISIGFHEIGHFLVFRYYGIKGSFHFENGCAMVRTRLYDEDIYRLNDATKQTLLSAGGFFDLVWLIPLLIVLPNIGTAVLFGFMLLYNSVETVSAAPDLHKKLSDVYFMLETKEEHEIFYKHLKESNSEYIMLSILRAIYQINPFLDIEFDIAYRKG